MPFQRIIPRGRCILLLSGMLTVVACSAFALVWMQQQINQTARSSVRLEQDLAEIDAKLRYIDEKISKSHQPVVLQGKVAGRLRPSKAGQIVQVTERSGITGRSYAHAAPYRAAADLAFVNLTTR